jgi:hypothetical protein
MEWVGVEAFLESFDVIVMALQNGRAVTVDHAAAALQESLYITLDKPLRAPLLCAANNARLTLDWLQELGTVSRDVIADLARVERERRDRLRMLRRAGAPR